MPIFSIISLIIFLMFFICFLKLSFPYLKTKSEVTKNLSKSILFLSFFFNCWSLPGIVIKDLKFIEISFDLSLLFLYLAIAYFFCIPLSLYGFQKFSFPLFLGIVFFGLGIFLFNILNLKPASIYFFNNFVLWEEGWSFLVRTVSWLPVSLAGLGAGLFFMAGGLKSQDQQVRLRSFLIASSYFFLLLGATMRFLFTFLMDIFWLTFIGLSCGIIAAILLIVATFFVKLKVRSNP